MNIIIPTNNFQLNISGFGGSVAGKDYAGTAFKLSGKMWDIVKSNNLKNKGKNIWVYENHDTVFAGIELENNADAINHGLETKQIDLPKYAYYKHVGSYNLIKQAGQSMIDQLAKNHFEITSPYIEIYGHWTNDETKLETELLMCLK